MTFKNQKIAELVKEEAAKFLEKESSGASLITVTGIKLSTDGKKALILFTIYPENKERQALDFAKRIRSDFRKHLTKETKIGRIPFIDFEIDKGEKIRQKVDSLMA